jgi:arylsulfatase A-like enzyme
MVARWPGRIPADTTSDHLISHIDLAATLARVVGRPLKEGEAPDSIDQLENLTHAPASPLRETLIITPNSPKHLGVRHGKWVYIPAQDSGGFQGKKVGDHLFAGAAALPFAGTPNSDVVSGKIRPDAAPGQLYDLESDPSQTQNIYRKHPEIVRELQVILDGYRKKIPRTERLGWINLKQ